MTILLVKRPIDQLTSNDNVLLTSEICMFKSPPSSEVMMEVMSEIDKKVKYGCHILGKSNDEYIQVIRDKDDFPEGGLEDDTYIYTPEGEVRIRIGE